MAIKTGSLKKEEGYVADSILIAELIDYAVEEGPFSYFELIEKLSSKIMGHEENEDEDALIHGRSPEKYLDVIVRHSKFFKDYFESVENDEYHSVEVSIPLGKLDSDDDDEDYSYVPEGSDEDDFWVQNMNADIEKEKRKEEKIKEEKEELRAQRGTEKEAYCHCPSDGVCYCEFPEDEEPQPKKELKDFVWLANNADQAYRESKALSQLNQSCQKEAMLVDYVKKLKHEAENLFNEYDVALAAADKIKDDKVNYNYLLGQAFTNKKIAERLADIAADLGHILEEQ